MFAKLYETDEGQILIMRSGDQMPEVHICFEHAALGVCEVSVPFANDKHGWKKADAYFHGLNEKGALRLIKRTLDKFNKESLKEVAGNA